MATSNRIRIAAACLWMGIAVTGLSPAATPSSESLSIESLLSAPFPYSLAAAPNADRVAWIFNHRGSRNIWMGERTSAGTMAAKALTQFKGDDDVELDDLKWSHDGAAIVFSRGVSLEGGGPVNPGDLSSGPIAKEISALRLGTTEVRSFGLGSNALPSPTGDDIVFVRDGQIWLANLATSSPATQLLNDRGAASDLAWSPNGKKLAFISNRKVHSLVGVLDLATRQIQWMSPSADRDTSPQWSPDSARLAWIRIPSSAVSPYLDAFTANREGQPWSLWVGDVANGTGKAAWTAAKGPGSLFYAIESGPSLFWAADNRLVYPWESSGWVRLYALDLNRAGADATPLSQDGAEVFAATLDRSRRNIIFSSNAGDDDHRHLWQVPVAGGRPQALSKGDSIEEFPVVTKDGKVFALHSTARKPLVPVMIDGNTSIKPLLASTEFGASPAEQLVAPERVVFKSPDGLSVHGQLFLPKTASKNKRSALLFFHGGPQRQMLLGWHPMGAYTHMYGMNQYLAAKGYVVLSVNFRGGTGYGLNFREPDEFAAGGGSEARDIAGAVDFLKARSDIDDQRIGVWGMSYGGVMTSLALARYPEAFAVGVDIAGVQNWKTFIPTLTEPGAEAAAELAFKASAMGTIADWRAPVLLIHGDDDRAVDFSQTTELVQNLRAVGKVEPEQLIIPNEVHDFILYRSWLRVFAATHEFLERHLRQGQHEQR